MLSNVSWKEYLMAVGTLLILYYLYIGFKYYRNELQQLLAGKKKQNSDNNNNRKKEETISLEELEAVVFDLRYAVMGKAGKDISKEELLRQLSERLGNYTGLRKPAYRVAINNAIIQHAKDSCGVAFSEDELNDAWDRLTRS